MTKVQLEGIWWWPDLVKTCSSALMKYLNIVRKWWQSKTKSIVQYVAYFLFQLLSLLTVLVSKIWMRWTLKLSVIRCTRHTWKHSSTSARNLGVPLLMSCARFLLWVNKWHHLCWGWESQDEFIVNIVP